MEDMGRLFWITRKIVYQRILITLLLSSFYLMKLFPNSVERYDYLEVILSKIIYLEENSRLEVKQFKAKQLESGYQVDKHLKAKQLEGGYQEDKHLKAKQLEGGYQEDKHLKAKQSEGRYQEDKHLKAKQSEGGYQEDTLFEVNPWEDKEQMDKHQEDINQEMKDIQGNVKADEALDRIKILYASNFKKVYMKDTMDYYYQLPDMNYYLVYEGLDESGQYYLIHLYEFVLDDEETGIGHTVTYGWFSVDRETGEILVKE